MADDADRADDIVARALNRAIAAPRPPMVVGVAGECFSCERRSPRLVGGRCAPCRDGRR